MDKRLNLKDFKKEALKNARVREEYESLRPEFELLMEFINARKAAKFSQEDLAKKLNVQQPCIARLENGGYSKTSVAKLTKIANALNCVLTISLQLKDSL
jgi:ribosome-binding protein aMBF1 (putative translation factor)